MSALIPQKVQFIGVDVGRGYTKLYSEFENNVYSTKFKSIVALGRDIDLSDYKENPIYIEVDNKKLFCGLLAEKEGHSPSHNQSDDKCMKTVQRLIFAGLSEVAMSSSVKIMLGVPNKLFKREVLNAVIDTYKGLTVKVQNKITGSFKEVTIMDILIYREADAGLYWHVRQYPTLKNGNIAMVNVGFRTTELCFYDRGFKFNDKRSKTIELGNKTALEYVQKQLSLNGVERPLTEIDSSDIYDEYKEDAYDMLSESITNEVENAWINLSEVVVCACGGTTEKLTLDYEIVEDPQMATAKGLYFIARSKFNA